MKRNIFAAVLVLLLLLLTGTLEEDATKLATTTSNWKEYLSKKVKTQTYLRATTGGEFIEIEQINSNGEKCYKVDVKLGSFYIPQVIKDNIKNRANDARIAVKLKNTLIQGINKIRISGVLNAGTEKITKINFDIPEAVHMESEYHASGVVSKRKLIGEGIICMNIRNLLLSGIGQILDYGKEIQIEDLSLNYDFNQLEVNIDNVQIEGLGAKQTQDIVYAILRCYLKDHSEQIGKQIANDIKSKVNEKLRGIYVQKIFPC